jgi:DNA-binding MarR family transcriptional regulator/N-acetylglutamate synthase-like GNAT family acetyltransferase
MEKIVTDVLTAESAVFLGSRFKRIAEQMHGQAARLLERAGLPLQPSLMPLLVTLATDGGQTIGALAEGMGLAQPTVTRAVGRLIELGFVEATRGDVDQRQKLVRLTAAGRDALVRARVRVANPIGAAVEEVVGDLTGPLFMQLAVIEERIAQEPLEQRAQRHNLAGVRIRDYDDTLAAAFKSINVEWITRMFTLEAADLDVLDHPREKILAGGGEILFAEVEGIGVVGTCALRRDGQTGYELTKMAVLEAARGAKIGEYLLAATIARAMEKRADPLYLLSNRLAGPAIHLYEKVGFVHDAAVMAEYGARYARCDVAMRYRAG